jgi:hypothetical protein
VVKEQQVKEKQRERNPDNKAKDKNKAKYKTVTLVSPALTKLVNSSVTGLAEHIDQSISKLGILQNNI